jgi:hypothetical protein
MTSCNKHILDRITGVLRASQLAQVGRIDGQLMSTTRYKQHRDADRSATAELNLEALLAECLAAQLLDHHQRRRGLAWRMDLSSFLAVMGRGVVHVHRVLCEQILPHHGNDPMRKFLRQVGVA